MGNQTPVGKCVNARIYCHKVHFQRMTFTLGVTVTLHKMIRRLLPVSQRIPECYFSKKKIQYQCTHCELSKRRESMAERTGRSAMTAVVITALGLSDACCAAFKLPPDEGFNPRIHTRCCKYQKM